MSEFTEASYERHTSKDIVVLEPVNELFNNEQQVAQIWLTEIGEDPHFFQDIKDRIGRMQDIFTVMDALDEPTTTLEEALGKGLVNEIELVHLYTHLTNLLLQKDYQRLILYLPFEFLPSSSREPESVDLQEALTIFKHSYLSAWYNQLSTYDVRANYVDGDVLEIEQREGDLPRVVKATHLIPELIARGMLTMKDITALYETTDDPLVKRGINEALTACDNPEASSTDTLTMESIPVALNTLHTEELQVADGLTDRRIAWLKETHRVKQVNAIAARIGHDISTNTLSRDTLSKLLETDVAIDVIVFIESVQQAIEQKHRAGDDSEELYKYFAPTLLHLWDTTPQDSDVYRNLLTSFQHNYHLGLVTKEELETRRITLPATSGSLSKNFELMPDELERIKTVTAAIQADPKLNTQIYPIITVGGSRLKGYGDHTSDTDLGIFVRPSVDISDAPNVRALVNKKLRMAGIDEKIFEIWLDDHNEQLSIKPVNGQAVATADPFSTHILFNTAWIGAQDEISTMQKRLLTPYFYLDSSEEPSDSQRTFYLERLEQDVLQYRLLHTGYDRRFPRVHTGSTFASSIDGDSAFWDAGYRQLATRLYIEKVFLPRLVPQK